MINPEDDWGCVPDEELFFNSGPTLDFKFLMNQFIQNIKNKQIKYKSEEENDKIKKEEKDELNSELINNNFDEDLNEEEVLEDEFMPLRIQSESDNDDDEIIIKDLFDDKKIEGKIQENKSTGGGILKKQNNKTLDNNSINTKRVSFEIERFVASNISDPNKKLTAQQKLIQKLGGKPPKNVSINYKKLKQQKLQENKNNNNFIEEFNLNKNKKGGGKNKKNNKGINKGKIKNRAKGGKAGKH